MLKRLQLVCLRKRQQLPPTPRAAEGTKQTATSCWLGQLDRHRVQLELPERGTGGNQLQLPGSYNYRVRLPSKGLSSSLELLELKGDETRSWSSCRIEIRLAVPTCALGVRGCGGDCKVPYFIN